jgi:hypothetical protein
MNQPNNLVAPGHERQWLLHSGGFAYLPLRRPAPGLTILVHGVNDIGEAFPYQEMGICQGLNERLDRGRGLPVADQDMQPTNYELPPQKNGKPFTAGDIHPDPDKVYFAPSQESPTSPVICFYWGFREETRKSNTKLRHGEYVDRFGNRLDKRYAKNGGFFANATTNIPDMFGAGLDYGWIVAAVDPGDPTHPLLNAPARNYMVLAAQRLAMLLRVMRKKSPQEVINIVAHSQGCFIATLAHAMLAKEGHGIKADTIIFNNWPYSVDEPWAEILQSGVGGQQTISARELTLQRILGDYVMTKPATMPAWSELKKTGRGVVGLRWQHDSRYERDNRGKCYLYFSPDDATVALINIKGIGYLGVYEGLRQRLGPRFLQRVFVRHDARNKAAPAVGSAPHKLKMVFSCSGTSLGCTEVDRGRTINGEALPHPFAAWMGPAQLPIGPVDAAIAVTNQYGGEAWNTGVLTPFAKLWSIPSLAIAFVLARLNIEKDNQSRRDKQGIRADETPEQAKARWLNQSGTNSYHSSIVSHAAHSACATAYDLSVGESGILKDNDLTWMRFLRAVADWRTNWFGTVTEERKLGEKDFSYPPPQQDLIDLLKSKEIDAADRRIVEGNWKYYCGEGDEAGKLPDFTLACTVESLAPYVVSQTRAERDVERKLDQIDRGNLFVGVHVDGDTDAQA